MADGAKVLNARIQLKTATASQWSNSNIVLLKGEIGIESDTRKFKIGTGIEGDTWDKLEYANITSLDNYYTKEDVRLIHSEITGYISDERERATKAEEALGTRLGTAESKLSGIAEGAQVNVIEIVKVNGSTQTVSGKSVNITIPTKTSDLDHDSGFLTSETDPTVPAWAKNATKPSYNKTEVGLGNVDNVQQIPMSQKGAASGVATLGSDSKILSSQLPDYILGQVLYGGTVAYVDSTDKITATLSSGAKAKLKTNSSTLNLTNTSTGLTGYATNEGIFYIATTVFGFAGIDFNIGDWLISNGAAWTKIDNTDAVATVAGRTGNVVLSVEDINGLSEYVGAVESVAEKAAYDLTVLTPKVTKLESDLPTELAKKVDKVSGKGLSTNDYTTAEKTKLGGIAENANNYSLPLAASGTRGGVQLGYSESNSGTSSNRNYAVKANGEKLYVNVPWDNTTYENASSSKAGLMSASDKQALDGLNDAAVVDEDSVIIDCGGANK